MTLMEFLDARLDEDAAVARYLLDSDPGPVEVHDTAPHDGSAYGMWIYDDDHRHNTLAIDPARVLAEVDAKRRIMGAHEKWCGGRCEQKADVGETFDAAHFWSLKALAAVYADHPEYRQEWAP